MYKYSFVTDGYRMAIAAPLASDRSAGAAARVTRVAVAGATGYAGQELVRILARHPAVTLTTAMSSGAASAPRPMPALAGSGTERSCRSTWTAWSATPTSFLALPEAASAELAPTLLERGVRVIDLSGAFRIRTQADRQRWVPGDSRAARRHRLRDDRRESGRHTAGGSSRIRAATPPRPCLARWSPWRPQGSSTGRFMWTRSRESRAPARRRQIARTFRKITAVSLRTGLLTSAHRGDRAGARANGHVRPASRAAGPWHPRDHLRITDAGHDRATGRRRARRA